MFCQFVIISVIAGALNAQSALRGVGGEPPQWNRPSSSHQIGPIGVNRHIDYSCIFYTNFTYRCKTDCGDDSDTETKSFPDRPLLKYTEFNCSTPVPTPGSKWSKENGMIDRYIDPSKPSDILATCAFFRTSWYECYGVADCGHGEGYTHCAGGAPWRGYFSGSPTEGFNGNVTAEAMNSPMIHPFPPQPPTGSIRKLLYSCEKFVGTDSSCHTFEKQCRTVAGQNKCRTIRRPYVRNTVNDSVFKRFDNVVNAITPESLAEASEVVAICYVFDNREYLCSFPFAVEFSNSDALHLSPADGSYYRGTL